MIIRQSLLYFIFLGMVEEPLHSKKYNIELLFIVFSFSLVYFQDLILVHMGSPPFYSPITSIPALHMDGGWSLS